VAGVLVVGALVVGGIIYYRSYKANKSEGAYEDMDDDA